MGRNEGGYFLGLLLMAHFGNAFRSFQISALVRSGLSLIQSPFNFVSPAKQARQICSLRYPICNTDPILCNTFNP